MSQQFNSPNPNSQTSSASMFSPSQCSRVKAVDRRTNSLKTLFFSFFYNRRRSLRRVQDGENGSYYVDVHETKLFVVVLAALLLCVADAFFTLTLINFHGSYELNPVMDYFIQEDTRQFFIIKFGLTALGIFFLVAHKNFKLFNRITGYQIIYACLGVYAILVCYELMMLVVLPFVSLF